ncbi:predicted protein [Uncinocarpus reesii 1704]|uniref:Aminoglycoside phosphotransferase domain-containing protein n=1 Tax=Uncinocarpus reesii (strain UAMH 1704) TaxID=336963 RepID=C4JX24_UNCRE|nr:uncharacterized protein UREG_06197 [Uncinocarpus reesii 1704]EEP81332.1 predicted protein [Uncinocarpus reesii 1704]
MTTVQLDELCAAAARCRGGFNVVYELIFSDDVVWMARIPLPYNCFQAEEVTASYAATLRYLKRNSAIPVPAVFAHCLQSNPDNKVNASYIIMEKLPGCPLPVIERLSLDVDPNDLALAKKVHEQLTDVLLELASFKFSQIGSLREDPEGNFVVGPYIDPNSTAYPQHRATAYKSLDCLHKGPFSSVQEWYSAMAQLNRKASLDDLDEEDGDEVVADYEILASFTHKVLVKEYENGPFVLNHNDLTVQNILVRT